LNADAIVANSVDTGAALLTAVLLFSDHLCYYNLYPLQSNQLAASPMLLFLLCWSRYVLFLLLVSVCYCCCTDI